MKKTRAVLVAVGIGAAVLATPVSANADTYDEMFTAVDWLAKKYGVQVYTDYAPMEYGTYAVTEGDVITFNSGYLANPELLESDIAEDVDAGYHPGGTCTPEQMVAAHEFAHVLDNLTGHTADNELIQAMDNGLSGEVSGYSFDKKGNINIDEALAEAFLAGECGTPTSAEQALFVMLTT